MPNPVDIEFCGPCGYGGPARDLKNFLLSSYPEISEINCHSASTITQTIKVSWVKNGALVTVWEKGRQETINNRETILQLLKQSA